MVDDTDTRRKNYHWQVRTPPANTPDMGRQLAVLMDIRDELQETNNHLRVIRDWFHQRGMYSAIRSTIAAANRKEAARVEKLRAARRARKAAAQ